MSEHLLAGYVPYGRRTITVVLFWQWVVFLLLSLPSFGQLNQTELSALKSACVFVSTSNSTGSGFLVYKKGNTGLLVTNHHVVTDQPEVVVSFHSGSNQQIDLKGKVVGVDEIEDLAVIRVESDKLPTPLKIEEIQPNSLAETQVVYCCGFPLGTALSLKGAAPEPTVSKGSLSSLRLGNLSIPEQLQADIAVNPGNSGGPLINAQGHVIGVVTIKLRGTDVCLAVPSSLLKEALNGTGSWVLGRFNDMQLGKTSVSFRGSLMDPMDKIEKVNLLLFEGPPKFAQDQSKQAVWSAMNGAKRVECIKSGSKFTCTETFDSQLLIQNKFFYQIESIRKNGSKHYTAPKRLSHPNTDSYSADISQVLPTPSMETKNLSAQDILAINKKLGPRAISPSIFRNAIVASKPEQPANPVKPSPVKPTPDKPAPATPAGSDASTSPVTSNTEKSKSTNPFREVRRNPAPDKTTAEITSTDKQSIAPPEAAPSRPQTSQSMESKSLETISSSWINYRPKSNRRTDRSMWLKPLEIEDGLSLNRILIDAKTLLPYLCWSHDGTSLVAVSAQGKLYSIHFPDSEKSLEVDLGFEVTAFGLTQLGLVVLTGDGEFVLFELPSMRVLANTKVGRNAKLFCTADGNKCFATASSGNVLTVDGIAWDKKIQISQTIDLGAPAPLNHYVDVASNRLIVFNGQKIRSFSISKAGIIDKESYDLPGSIADQIKTGSILPMDDRRLAILTRSDDTSASGAKNLGSFTMVDSDSLDLPIISSQLADRPLAACIGPNKSVFVGGNNHLWKWNVSGTSDAQPFRIPGRPGKIVCLSTRQSDHAVAILSAESLFWLTSSSLNSK